MYNPPGSTIYESPLMLQLIELLPTLNPALRKVAEFILRDPLHAATLNIHELGTSTETSTAAVHRLAKTMGLTGFIELRAVMLVNLRGWVSTTGQARGESQASVDGEFDLERQVRQAKGNLDAVIDSNPPAVFEAAVNALDSARHLYCLGFGNGFHLAGLFSSMLLPLGNISTLVSTDGGFDITAHRIAPITSEDLLVAVALPPCSLETERLAHFAKATGARVLALTDGPTSPLAAIADLALYAPPNHPVLQNSKGALLNVIEALVSAIHLRHAARIRLALEQAHTARSYLYGLDLPTLEAVKPVQA